MTPLACIAAQIATVVRTDDLVYLADDEQQAQALAAALRAMLPEAPVFFVPSSDALPGDVAPASPANVGARVAALHALRLAQQERDRPRLACVMSGEAAARRYAMPDSFDRALPRLAVGDPIPLESFAEMLVEIGYFADDRVDEPGEMAVRGDVIDIFPADAGLPARIEIQDGAIAAIRSYDPTTQRSVADLDGLEIGRANEPAGERSVSILAHLAPATIAFSDKADKRRRRFVQLARDALRGSGATLDAIDDDAWREALPGWRTVTLDAPFETVPRFAEARSPLAAMARFARPLLAERALVLAGSERDLRFLRTRVAKRLGIDLPLLADWAEAAALAPGAAGLLHAPVDAGFVGDTRVLIAAADLLGSRAMLESATTAAPIPWSIGGSEIRIGDVVVHEDHGVGVVAGLEPAPAAGGGGEGEMIALEYAGGARRLVGVEETDRLWRYGSDADAVTLDKLDGSSWQKRRAEISAAIEQSAQGLAALAEARAKLVAPVLAPDAAAYERFAGGFAFNETADQARAIAAVRADLASGKPMDRLIVGDVGYGKTEVALRAAALAALAGCQVVVAAPTTVLVRQHLESFRRRFAASGLNVAGLSRLSSAAEKREVKAGLADGSIHIVIGTGAVMAKGVRYAKLGLVVIDEEQRFGAADKAKLRGSGEMHLLSLSATPIPRTLQMALVGLQQVSTIATPPARRQPIRTSLDQFDDARIRTALLREKSRGGQSFVVVPRIEDMARLRDRLQRIVPDLTLVEAHGKMPAADIDAVMVGFADGAGDILLATNIIEAGLDVPRANTMIVWRADRFGLAQLHQLRGRVGRGNRRGQVLLLTDDAQAIGDRTLKRLRTLATFDRLGAGFEISAHDLDMRGAGDLLGDTQAGHMKLIGVDLYQHLLGIALRTARGETVDDWTPELNLGLRGMLPEAWIPEADVRLTLYVRLGRIADESMLDAFEEELVDRFGPVPDAAATLLAQARLRLAARHARICRVDAGPSAIALTPFGAFAGDPGRHGLVAKNDRLLLAEPIPDDRRIERTQALLEDLAA
ncbi:MULTISPECIES: DEAD/DEAH box helicase [unclassified Sphingomonas]|uniref:DEAD/DEAH box helicase n=1 Tax=unclassified Sphingomonas TaxID=196159 RepID=UPI000311AA69|nr:MULTISPECIES: DEAD/DEAH box helicase [unclassified Sphingomonas]KTF67804.1 DEAD/DEAH box helicase [Sphingomonas sp. WG]